MRFVRDFLERSGQACDDRPAGGQAYDGQPAGGQACDDRSTSGQACDDQPTGGLSSGDRPICGHAASAGGKERTRAAAVGPWEFYPEALSEFAGQHEALKHIFRKGAKPVLRRTDCLLFHILYFHRNRIHFSFKFS
jgi:hypothetical protein